MRCLPGCVASAVGGRAAAPPSRGRGVLLRRLTAAPLRRCAAFARAWCVASAAYGCALAGQKGRFPLDFHFVKVSPLSPAARRTSLRRLRRLRFAVFMRCLPGCAASAVGGRVVQSASAKSIHWIDS
ncbi:ornithine carbamoyltransferase [Mobiluncus mulieris]|uniref:ornithine carbamoyltransferase n=1 Tax=Mobiluncus mulieris TaxID=2052 RepID=UPI002014DBDE|nr:ornithine carbamoyltransferase [Mobiluncus mulieris]